jgi:hypothetical protein
MTVLATLMVDRRSSQFLTVDAGLGGIHLLPEGAQVVRGWSVPKGRYAAEQ